MKNQITITTDHLPTMPIGSMVLYNKVNSIPSWIQRFWWRVMNYKYKDLSHLSVYKGFDQCGTELEAEANLQVDQTTFRFNEGIMEVYVPRTTEAVAIRSINEGLAEHEEKLYGFISWVAILIRGVLESLGFKKVYGWNILWGWGVMCSEFGHYVMSQIAWYSKYHTDAHLSQRWSRFYDRLLEFNPDIFTPVDARMLYDEFPDLWDRYIPIKTNEGYKLIKARRTQ